MTPDLDHRLDLAGQILCLLREHPEGLSEYQLIQLLKARHSTHIPHRELADKLVLFRTHFLLFNALYHLRDHLWAEREAHLEISPLSLRLHPYVDGTQALEQGDPLRDYYLDLRHLGRPARPTSSGCCRVSGRACRAARGEGCRPRPVRAGGRGRLSRHQAALPATGQPAPSRPRRQHCAPAIDQQGDGNTATLLQPAVKLRFALNPRATRARAVPILRHKVA